MKYIIIAIILVILYILLGYFGHYPYRHRKISQNDLGRFINALLKRGDNGSFMKIQVQKDKKPKRIVQISLYGDKVKDQGMQLDFPLAEWSKPYYEKLKEVMTTNNIPFEIEKTDEVGVPEFLVIDIKKGLKRAEKITKLILQDVYELSPDDTVEIYLVNVREINER
jgi:hypothetical protein